MATGTDTLVIDDWLEGVLRAPAIAGVGDKVYGEKAPKGAAFPFIVFAMQPGNFSLNALGAVRILESADYLVRVIKPTGSFADADLRGAAREIDARLNRGFGTPPGGGEVFACWRTSEFKLLEQEDDVQIRHLGGFYRILAREG